MELDRTFFITTVTWKRIPIFRVETRARLFVDVLLDYRKQGKYLLHEFVVMPDHVHALITLVPEVSLERAMQFVKGGFSFRLRKVEKIEVCRRVSRIIESGMRGIMSGIASIFGSIR